jgi:ABC-2 type transport system permease protein
MRSAESINSIKTIFKRELGGYFNSPVAYVFIVVFLLTLGFFTFYISRFFEAGQADLQGFFQWHPWMYLFLIPAVAMRLWAEERRLGTIELVLTFPVTVVDVILGKFLAAWFFIGISLALTFPMLLTVGYLGNPDLGAALCGYAGSFLMAGAFPQRRQHDIRPFPQPGGGVHSGSDDLPVFHPGRVSAGDRYGVEPAAPAGW